MEDIKDSLSKDLKELIIKCLTVDEKKRFSIQQIGECSWMREINHPKRDISTKYNDLLKQYTSTTNLCNYCENL